MEKLGGDFRVVGLAARKSARGGGGWFGKGVCEVSEAGAVGAD